MICCDRNLEDRTYRFEINNESADNIVIQVFESTTRNEIKTFDLGKNGGISQDFIANEKDVTPTVHNLLEGDSVRIVFKNSDKLLVYKCNAPLALKDDDCIALGNIDYDGAARWLREEFDDLYLHIYTFTEIDLAEAIPCNGNCD